MADFLQNEIKVTVNGDEYAFEIPAPRKLNATFMRAAALRRQDDPLGMGSEQGLDAYTANSYLGMAMMESLLKRASVTWPFTASETEKGKLVVRSEKFPTNIPPDTFPKMYQEVMGALATFHKGGAGDGEPGGSDGVASQPDPQQIPLL